MSFLSARQISANALEALLRKPEPSAKARKPSRPQMRTPGAVVRIEAGEPHLHYPDPEANMLVIDAMTGRSRPLPEPK